MGIERYLFFWAGGIFTPTVDAAAVAALKSYGADCPGLSLDPAFKKMKEDLLLNRIGTREFCGKVLSLCSLQTDAGDFEDHIITNLSIRQKALDCLSALKSGLKTWLIVDLPKTWFSEFSGVDALTSLFPADHVLYLQDSGLGALLPDIFDLILRVSSGQKEECLVLDPDLKRAVASINRRLPAAVIIDAGRLEREFLLRGLIKGEYRVHSRPV